MRRLLNVAGVLLLIHGLLEMLSLFSFLDPSYRPSFIFQEIAQNWQLAVLVGVIAGSLRILAAAGILANRKWGWGLGVLISAITFAMLTFYLPFGVMDGLLAGAVLALLVICNYGGARIVE